jgi:hypothetical protein
VLSLYGAVLLAAAGLLCTLKAAPIMLSVSRLDDPAALGQAWGSICAVCQLLAFFATVFALAKMGQPSHQAGRLRR